MDDAINDTAWQYCSQLLFMGLTNFVSCEIMNIVSHEARALVVVDASLEILGERHTANNITHSIDKGKNTQFKVSIPYSTNHCFPWYSTHTTRAISSSLEEYSAHIQVCRQLEPLIHSFCPPGTHHC